LETMTPLDFLDFRDLLSPASGFQSVQFRAIEIRLGLRPEDRMKLDDKRFELFLSERDRARIAAAEAGPKLIDQLDAWLARTPLRSGGGALACSATPAARRWRARSPPMPSRCAPPRA